MANKQIKLKHVKEASTLYHYTKCNGLNGILENNCFWATKSDFLNDPKEFSYIEAIIRDVCKELIKNEDWREMFLKDVLEEKVFLDGGRNKEYFILSFSKCRDSITMWSEFGNKTGYNIGFDSKKIIKRIEEDNIIEYHGFVLYEKAQQKEAPGHAAQPKKAVKPEAKQGYTAPAKKPVSQQYVAEKMKTTAERSTEEKPEADAKVEFSEWPEE